MSTTGIVTRHLRNTHVSTTSIGRAAEQQAAAFLSAQGFTIVAQNWRTRWCEIDIVASNANIVYFVEVKYRRNTQWGDGLEYITSRKLQQMTFAAQFYMATLAAKHSKAHNYRLSAVALSGEPPQVTAWLADI